MQREVFAEYEDAAGLDRTAEAQAAQFAVERDAAAVMTFAAALLGTNRQWSVEAAVLAARDAYFSLLSDEAFAEFSIAARAGSAVPRLLGLRPQNPRS